MSLPPRDEFVRTLDGQLIGVIAAAEPLEALIVVVEGGPRVALGLNSALVLAEQMRSAAERAIQDRASG